MEEALAEIWRDVSADDTVRCAVLRGAYHLYQGVPAFFGNVAMGVLFGWLYSRYGRLLPLGRLVKREVGALGRALGVLLRGSQLLVVRDQVRRHGRRSGSVHAPVVERLDTQVGRGAALVVEAVPEDLDLKRRVLAEAASACPDAVLASNTCGLAAAASVMAGSGGAMAPRWGFPARIPTASGQATSRRLNSRAASAVTSSPPALPANITNTRRVGSSAMTCNGIAHG